MVILDGLREVNLNLFWEVNRWPESWSPFLRFFSEAMNRSWFKIAMVVLLIGMLARNSQTRITAICALIAVGLANASTDLWKNLMPEARPFQELTGVILRAGSTLHPGTASAHAANMAAVATVFVVRQKGWGIPWAVAALLTGISRLYVGVHYPYQVLLGWSCGVGVALLVLLACKRILPSTQDVGTGEGYEQTNA